MTRKPCELNIRTNTYVQSDAISANSVALGILKDSRVLCEMVDRDGLEVIILEVSGVNLM
jgi:hypothetical protein